MKLLVYGITELSNKFASKDCLSKDYGCGQNLQSHIL